MDGKISFCSVPYFVFYLYRFRICGEKWERDGNERVTARIGTKTIPCFFVRISEIPFFIGMFFPILGITKNNI
jgi:hypothetical protein